MTTVSPVIYPVNSGDVLAGQKVFAVVERILDRWKLHDFWLVEFEALDVYEGVTVRNTFTFSTAREAYKFKPGRAVSWRYEIDDSDDGLPF